MGSKINLNINKEWEEEVLPILEEWKKTEGNFSDKVCESIVFMKQATAEHIYQAIMAYEAKPADQSTNGPLLEEWEKEALRILQNGANPLYFLTESVEGPLLSPARARTQIRRLKSLKIVVPPEKETEYLLKRQPLHRVRWGTGDLLKLSPQEAEAILKTAEINLEGFRQYVKLSGKLGRRPTADELREAWYPASPSLQASEAAKGATT